MTQLLSYDIRVDLNSDIEAHSLPMGTNTRDPGMTSMAKTLVGPSYAWRRRAALAACATTRKVDAAIVSAKEDVSYLTGFSGEDSVVVFSREWAFLVTDGRYQEQAAQECSGIAIHVRTESTHRAVASVIKGRNVRRLGVQAEHITLQARDMLQSALGSRTIVPVAGLTLSIRATKSSAELACIRKAIRVAEKAIRKVIAPGARALIGKTEREVAAKLEYHMMCLGASGAAFETIVACGANSSRPHYRPGDVRIKRGQAVLIDWGARVAGYCSDLTRTFFTGTIPPKLAKVYGVVLHAQAAGIACVSPGRVGRSVDLAARKIVAAAGFGDAFIHSLGHGIGLAVHEQPVLGSLATGRLRKAMVVTVEPGVYLPGIGGVRIEDDVLVTSTGRQRLSRLPRRLDSMLLR